MSYVSYNIQKEEIQGWKQRLGRRAAATLLAQREERAQAKERRWPLEAGKGKGMDSPLELLERT